MSTISKVLDWVGFRTMAAWLADKMNALYANIKADYNANIKKQTICSMSEYLEMYNAGTLQEDMLYLVFNEDKEMEG